MRDLLPEIEDLTTDAIGKQLLDIHDYWLKRRILFNVIVGSIGLLSTILYARSFSIFDLFGVLMWGFVANGLYSFGYAVESFALVKTNKPKLKSFRGLLFWSGTFLYSAVSFLFASEYYINSGNF